MLYIVTGLILCNCLGTETFQGQIFNDTYILDQDKLEYSFKNDLDGKANKMLDVLINGRGKNRTTFRPYNRMQPYKWNMLKSKRKIESNKRVRKKNKKKIKDEPKYTNPSISEIGNYYTNKSCSHVTIKVIKIKPSRIVSIIYVYILLTEDPISCYDQCIESGKGGRECSATCADNDNDEPEGNVVLKTLIINSRLHNYVLM